MKIKTIAITAGAVLAFVWHQSSIVSANGIGTESIESVHDWRNGTTSDTFGGRIAEALKCGENFDSAISVEVRGSERFSDYSETVRKMEKVGKFAERFPRGLPRVLEIEKKFKKYDDVFSALATKSELAEIKRLAGTGTCWDGSWDLPSDLDSKEDEFVKTMSEDETYPEHLLLGMKEGDYGILQSGVSERTASTFKNLEKMNAFLLESKDFDRETAPGVFIAEAYAVAVKNLEEASTRFDESDSLFGKYDSKNWERLTATEKTAIKRLRESANGSMSPSFGKALFETFLKIKIEERKLGPGEKFDRFAYETVSKSKIPDFVRLNVMLKNPRLSKFTKADVRKYGKIIKAAKDVSEPFDATYELAEHRVLKTRKFSGISSESANEYRKDVLSREFSRDSRTSSKYLKGLGFTSHDLFSNVYMDEKNVGNGIFLPLSKTASGIYSNVPVESMKTVEFASGSVGPDKIQLIFATEKVSEPKVFHNDGSSGYGEFGYSDAFLQIYGEEFWNTRPTSDPVMLAFPTSENSWDEQLKENGFEKRFSSVEIGGFAYDVYSVEPISPERE